MDYERVREAMESRMRALGINRSQVAARAGVDRSLITKLLAGKPWTMRSENLGKIERVLRMRPGEIELVGAGAELSALEPADEDVERRLADLEGVVAEQHREVRAVLGAQAQALAELRELVLGEPAPASRAADRGARR